MSVSETKEITAFHGLPGELPATAKDSALCKARITRDLSYKVLHDGLLATRTVDKVESNGDITKVEVPDHIVRHKYLETHLKMIGDLKDKQEIELGYKISDEDRALLEKYGVIGGSKSGKSGASGDK